MASPIMPKYGVYDATYLLLNEILLDRWFAVHEDHTLNLIEAFIAVMP